MLLSATLATDSVKLLEIYRLQNKINFVQGTSLRFQAAKTHATPISRRHLLVSTYISNKTK